MNTLGKIYLITLFLIFAIIPHWNRVNSSVPEYLQWGFTVFFGIIIIVTGGYWIKQEIKNSKEKKEHKNKTKK